MFWNSASLMVFLLAAQVSTSLPAKYRRFGLLFVTASKIVLFFNVLVIGLIAGGLTFLLNYLGYKKKATNTIMK
jgi:hypothetical protein